MGEHVIGNLASAVKTVTVSRKRALQLLGGALAVAAPTRLPHAAEAGKRRKPPQAFLAIAIQGVTIANGGYLWGYQAQLKHADSSFTKDLSGTTTGTNFNTSQDKTREAIISGARSLSRTFLLQAGHDVAEDRIAVVLL